VLNLTSNKICADIVAPAPLPLQGSAVINGMPIGCDHNKCYFYNVTENKWVDPIAFHEERSPKAFTQLVNGPWIVSGGGKTLLSVEYYDGEKFQVIQNILPRPMSGHCQVSQLIPNSIVTLKGITIIGHAGRKQTVPQGWNTH